MRILFVCSGNICRSPTAEGVMRHIARERGLDIEADSAGIRPRRARYGRCTPSCVSGSTE